MARRRTASKKPFERYPNVYAKTTDTWTTRYYQRKKDAMMNLLGLSTSPDDFHKPEGSSPYLRNARHQGEREENQRAQVMSRKGAVALESIGEDVVQQNEASGQTYLEVYEGKAIEYTLLHNKRLTGIFLHLFNVDSATGYIKITIRNYDSKVEITNAVIDTRKISTTRYSEHYVRFIRSVLDTRVSVRIEILDDVDTSQTLSTREKRGIRILSRITEDHEYAEYTLPNANGMRREIPYDFKPGRGAPLTGLTTNDWEPMKRSEEFRSGGKSYIIFPVRHDSVVELYRQDLETKSISYVTNLVSRKATVVRFDQAEGYLYYVDNSGESPFRRINLTTMVAEDVIPKQEEITTPGVTPASLTAKKGASLIHFLNNRIYLAGFKDDPNLVIVSMIDDVKPRFEQFNDRFYSPDQSPELSAGNPITALASISDMLVVWRLSDLSMHTAGDGFEVGGTSQITPEGAALGVLNQEAVCQGKNNIYFFNPIEGVCRFAGSVNRDVSGDIDNLIRKIKHPESIFMLYQNKRVHMFFSFDEVKPDSRLYYYTELEGKLPWYLDTNTPVSSAIPAKDSNRIYAVHSEVATTMELDSQFTDFDSYIELEYNTQYRTPDDVNGWVYVKRIHIHEIANSTHSIYVGLDVDHQDNPTVWRKFVNAVTDKTVNPDAIFPHSAEPGNAVISIHCHIKCRAYQVRLKRYCYKDTGEIMAISTEFGNKDAI